MGLRPCKVGGLAKGELHFYTEISVCLLVKEYIVKRQVAQHFRGTCSLHHEGDEYLTSYICRTR